jgi:hypothetical protein
MWGFQWGIFSSKKWLPNARGMAKAGLATLVAMAAATTTCGVSSTVICILKLSAI